MQPRDSWSWTRRTFMKSSVAGALLLVGRLVGPPAARSEADRNCQAAPESHAPHKSEMLPSCLPWQEVKFERRSRFEYQLCPGRIFPDGHGTGI